MTRPSRRRSAALASATAFAVIAAVPTATASMHSAATAAVTPTGAAAGAPGAPSYFDLARKDCLGTARNGTSKVWYTVADGVLSDVYEPTIDNTNVSTLQYVVTDGSSFTDLQTRDMTYTARSDASGMACTITSTDAKHGYRLTTTYVTDPLHDSVLMNTRLSATPGSHTDVRKLHVYA
ncbi:MAG: glucodextranase DOMON-like domain-containing protein, partial [Actinocrinis sp.]